MIKEEKKWIFIKHAWDEEILTTTFNPLGEIPKPPKHVEIKGIKVLRKRNRKI